MASTTEVATTVEETTHALSTSDTRPTGQTTRRYRFVAPTCRRTCRRTNVCVRTDLNCFLSRF